MSNTKRALLYLQAVFYAFAGFNHLLNPDFYVAIIPPKLPSPEWLNVLSGLAEIVLGVALLAPRLRVYAAWGIIALLIAVFPANVYIVQVNMDVFTGELGAGSVVANWIRLPFQLVFIAWAWWYTGPADAE